ncbi:DddA-like double-stranded DNA deaminase toxin [Amycolatopsis sp. NPDC051372]|uniref:DddA-like double-stranded DNA deaminase toxin n=1 Tax=Amycolatopsis sp. NPDC051372 TaxID=3155669 RepID=UPI0034265205
MAVEGVAERARNVLALISTARTALSDAHSRIVEVGPIWRQAFEGTGDPDAAQLPALADSVATGIGEWHAATMQAERLLTGYLTSLGANASSPAAPPPPAGPEPPAHADRIAQARARVGESHVRGSQARGEWLRSDGWSVRMASGGGDEHHAAALRFIRDNNLPRPASQLARHVEVKVAISMWVRGLRDETVVMDRPVCGTREFDRDDPFTCDKYLARFLPPGARLRVVQPDGTVSDYTGTETEQQ